MYHTAPALIYRATERRAGGEQILVAEPNQPIECECTVKNKSYRTFRKIYYNDVPNYVIRSWYQPDGMASENTWNSTRDTVVELANQVQRKLVLNSSSIDGEDTKGKSSKKDLNIFCAILSPFRVFFGHFRWFQVISYQK